MTPSTNLELPSERTTNTTTTTTTINTANSSETDPKEKNCASDTTKLDSILKQLKNTEIKYLTLTLTSSDTDNFSEEDWKTFSKALSESTLGSLDLKKNNIDDRAVKHLASALIEHRYLRNVSLSNNNIGDKGAEYLATVLCSCKNTNLWFLDLSQNDISDIGAAHLASALKKNTTLLSLDLAKNNIGDTGSEHFISVLHIKNTTLKHLILSGNCVSDINLEFITSACKKNTLKKLNLNDDVSKNLATNTESKERKQDEKETDSKKEEELKELIEAKLQNTAIQSMIELADSQLTKEECTELRWLQQLGRCHRLQSHVYKNFKNRNFKEKPLETTDLKEIKKLCMDFLKQEFEEIKNKACKIQKNQGTMYLNSELIRWYNDDKKTIADITQKEMERVIFFPGNSDSPSPEDITILVEFLKKYCSKTQRLIFFNDILPINPSIPKDALSSESNDISNYITSGTRNPHYWKPVLEALFKEVVFENLITFQLSNQYTNFQFSDIFSKKVQMPIGIFVSKRNEQSDNNENHENDDELFLYLCQTLSSITNLNLKFRNLSGSAFLKLKPEFFPLLEVFTLLSPRTSNWVPFFEWLQKKENIKAINLEVSREFLTYEKGCQRDKVIYRWLYNLDPNFVKELRGGKYPYLQSVSIQGVKFSVGQARQEAEIQARKKISTLTYPTDPKEKNYATDTTKLDSILEQLKGTKSFKLTSIDAGNFSEKDWKTFFEALSNSTTLETLDLSETKIDDRVVNYLASALIENISMKSLQLSNNNIGDKGAKYLNFALSKNTNLTYIDLANNGIGDIGAEHLAFALKKNTTLKGLDLTNNSINDKGAEHLASALIKNTSLVALMLGKNKIGDKGAEHLAFALIKNYVLNYLDLAKNNIGDTGAEHFASVLHTDTISLKNLDLSDNCISDIGFKLIIEACKNTTLKKLNLNGNGSKQNVATDTESTEKKYDEKETDSKKEEEAKKLDELLKNNPDEAYKQAEVAYKKDPRKGIQILLKIAKMHSHLETEIKLAEYYFQITHLKPAKEHLQKAEELLKSKDDKKSNVTNEKDNITNPEPQNKIQNLQEKIKEAESSQELDKTEIILSTIHSQIENQGFYKDLQIFQRIEECLTDISNCLAETASIRQLLANKYPDIANASSSSSGIKSLKKKDQNTAKKLRDNSQEKINERIEAASTLYNNAGQQLLKVISEKEKLRNTFYTLQEDLKQKSKKVNPEELKKRAYACSEQYDVLVTKINTLTETFNSMNGSLNSYTKHKADLLQGEPNENIGSSSSQATSVKDFNKKFLSKTPKDLARKIAKGVSSEVTWKEESNEEKTSHDNTTSWSTAKQKRIDNHRKKANKSKTPTSPEQTVFDFPPNSESSNSSSSSSSSSSFSSSSYNSSFSSSIPIYQSSTISSGSSSTPPPRTLGTVTSLEEKTTTKENKNKLENSLLALQKTIQYFVDEATQTKTKPNNTTTETKDTKDKNEELNALKEIVKRVTLLQAILRMTDYLRTYVKGQHPYFVEVSRLLHNALYHDINLEKTLKTEGITELALELNFCIEKLSTLLTKKKISNLNSLRTEIKSDSFYTILKSGQTLGNPKKIYPYDNYYETLIRNTKKLYDKVLDSIYFESLPDDVQKFCEGYFEGILGAYLSKLGRMDKSKLSEKKRDEIALLIKEQRDLIRKGREARHTKRKPASKNFIQKKKKKNNNNNSKQNTHKSTFSHSSHASSSSVSSDSTKNWFSHSTNSSSSSSSNPCLLFSNTSSFSSSSSNSSSSFSNKNTNNHSSSANTSNSKPTTQEPKLFWDCNYDDNDDVYAEYFSANSGNSSSSSNSNLTSFSSSSQTNDFFDRNSYKNYITEDSNSYTYSSSSSYSGPTSSTTTSSSRSNSNSNRRKQ